MDPSRTGRSRHASPSVSASNGAAAAEVSRELLKLVLDKLQEDYDAQQASRRIEAGETPAAEQTIDVKPSDCE